MVSFRSFEPVMGLAAGTCVMTAVQGAGMIASTRSSRTEIAARRQRFVRRSAVRSRIARDIARTWSPTFTTCRCLPESRMHACHGWLKPTSDAWAVQ